MRRKTNDKVVKFCVVCGDKAKGLNFNALTCQSCKAFFRRNALSNKEFKCSFTNSCDIDIVSRKFCSSCRLKKCFENGMKKEWILSEEEKHSIREKIMINRLRKGKLQQFCHNDLLINPSTPQSVASASVVPSTMDYLTKNRTDSLSSSSTSSSIIHTVNSEEPDNNSHNQVMNFKLISSSSFSPTSSVSSSNAAASPPTTSTNNHLHHLHHLHHHAIDAVQQHFFAYNIKQFTPTIICGGQTNHDGYFSNHSNDPHPSKPQQNSILQAEINQIDPMINVVGFFNSQPPPSSSIINADDDDRPPSNEFRSTIEEFVSCFTTTDTSLSKNKDDENHPVSDKDFLRNFLAKFNHKHFDFGTYPCIFNLDPLTEISVKLEQHVFRMFDGKNFTVKEKYKLQELALAGSMLNNPYKRIAFFQTPGNVDGHPCVLVESCLHRMMAMSKRLAAFNSLSLDDQVVLLKFGLIEMFCLRTVLTFDSDQQTWTFVDDKCKLSALVYMDAVKPCCIGYDYRSSVTNFYSGFKHEWKTDNVIMDLLTAMVLFTQRNGISAREQIREARIEYSELLKHYLEMKYPAAIDAHVSYDRLLLTVKAMQLLHHDLLHVIASTVGHSLDSPLMAQLTDHYQKQPQLDDEHRSQCNIERLTRKKDVSDEQFDGFGSTAARSSSTSETDTSDVNQGMTMDDVAIDHDGQTPNNDVQFLTIDDNRFCF